MRLSIQASIVVLLIAVVLLLNRLHSTVEAKVKADSEWHQAMLEEEYRIRLLTAQQLETAHRFYYEYSSASSPKK